MGNGTGVVRSTVKSRTKFPPDEPLPERLGPMGQLANQCWGDRTGTVIDPEGYHWTIATHTEDLTPEEMKQRMDAFMKNLAAPQPAHQ